MQTRTKLEHTVILSVIGHTDFNTEVAGVRAAESPEEFPGGQDTEESEHAPENGDALLVHA